MFLPAPTLSISNAILKIADPRLDETGGWCCGSVSVVKVQANCSGSRWRDHFVGRVCSKKSLLRTPNAPAIVIPSAFPEVLERLDEYSTSIVSSRLVFTCILTILLSQQLPLDLRKHYLTLVT